MLKPCVCGNIGCGVVHNVILQFRRIFVKDNKRLLQKSSQMGFVDVRNDKKLRKWAELSDESLDGGGTLWLLIKNALISLINNCKQRFMPTISFHNAYSAYRTG